MFMPQNGPLRHDFKEAYVFRAVPGWADVFALEGEARIRALADPATRARLKASVDGPSEGLPVVVRNWASYEVNDVEDPALVAPPRVATSASWRRNGTSPRSTPCSTSWSQPSSMWGSCATSTPRTSGPRAARLEVLKDPRVVLGASDAGAHGEMMVGADFPTRCIGELVRDKEIFTVEEMVHQFSDVHGPPLRPEGPRPDRAGYVGRPRRSSTWTGSGPGR